MFWIDAVILCVFLLSALLSSFQGLGQALFSLFSWLLACSIALYFMPNVAQLWVYSDVDQQEVLSTYDLNAFLILLLSSFLVNSFVHFLWLQSSNVLILPWHDRLLSALLGVCRGIVLVFICVQALEFLPFIDLSRWSESNILNLFRLLTRVI
jgi:uncharacterized membrane protein required for colicin V production